jgi:tRNA G46 methylase TrmB
MNAIAGITHFIPSESVSRVFINYPNPNYKNPALRWFRMPFFCQVMRILKPNGTIQVLSNQEWYAREALLAAKTYWNLSVEEDITFDQNAIPGGSPRTHFEKKYLAKGEKCRQLIFRKSVV